VQMPQESGSRRIVDVTSVYRHFRKRLSSGLRRVW
jgi:hypothetical protein